MHTRSGKRFGLKVTLGLRSGNSWKRLRIRRNPIRRNPRKKTVNIISLPWIQKANGFPPPPPDMGDLCFYLSGEEKKCVMDSEIVVVKQFFSIPDKMMRSVIGRLEQRAQSDAPEERQWFFVRADNSYAHVCVPTPLTSEVLLRYMKCVFNGEHMNVSKCRCVQLVAREQNGNIRTNFFVQPDFVWEKSKRDQIEIRLA